MRSTHMIQRVCAILLCITLFGATVMPVNARSEDFLLSLFLLSLLDEYGLTDIAELLLLLGLEHEDDLYDLYHMYGDTDQSSESIFSNHDMYGYDAEGYPVYEDEATGFLYGVYDSDEVYITGHRDAGSWRDHALIIPAALDGMPVYCISSNAFADVQGLSSVTIMDGVTQIGTGAFQGSSVRSIWLPPSVKYIEYDAFLSCTYLERLELSEGLEFIGATAFAECDNLSRVTIPNSVTTIDFDAFMSCDSLQYVHLGAGLDDMTGNVFSECPALAFLTVSSSNRCYYVQDDILYHRMRASMVRYPAPIRNERNFVVPDGVETIENSCFGDMNQLRHIILPDTVKHIEDYAFCGCVNLEQIDLGNSLQSIGYGAIPINSMRGIHLPDTLRTMEEYGICVRTDWPDKAGSFVILANSNSKGEEWAKQNGYEVYAPTPERINLIAAQNAGDNAAAAGPVLKVMPEDVEQGSWVTFELIQTDGNGEVRFHIGGEEVGKATFFHGVASCTWQAQKAGVHTITAVQGSQSIAMERLIVRTSDYVPVVHQLMLPCTHEAGHTLCEDVEIFSYRAAYVEDCHISRREVHPAWVCNKCGMYVIDEGVSTQDVEERHSFQNGVCVCGIQEYAMSDPTTRYSISANLFVQENGDIYLPDHTVLRLSIHDSQTDGYIRDTGRLFEFVLEDRQGLLEEIQFGEYQIASRYSGSAQIVLKYLGTEVDRVTVRNDTYVEDPSWWSTSQTATSEVVFLADMNSFDWGNDVLFINQRLMLENFHAEEVAGGYQCTFNIYNESPVAYGIFSYDENGKIRQKELISGYWYESAILPNAIDFFGSVGKFVMGKNSVNFVGKEKTKIDIFVPYGGALRFVPPDQDTDLYNFNVFQAGLGSVLIASDSMGLGVDVMSGLGDVSLQSWAKLFAEEGGLIIADVHTAIIQEETNVMMEHFMNNINVSAVVWAVLKGMGSSALGVLEDKLLGLVTGGISNLITGGFDVVGGNLSMILLHKDLRFHLEHPDTIGLKMVVFPR